VTRDPEDGARLIPYAEAKARRQRMAERLDHAAARRSRLRRLAAVILAVGLGSAVAIYFIAGPDSENPLGYDPMQTKTYLHDLELYGGKANVLAAEFREWFTGLWMGRNLAFTIAVLAFLAFLAIRYVAAAGSLEPLDETEDETGPPAPGV
jgi:peptidoglycan/LPS O-acetylase OafA/YrhL